MTRNTTSYREKGRAVVLAALMVLSVVAMGAAFAAPAAADHADDEKEIGANGGSIIQGQTAIVNVSNLNPTDGTVELYEDLENGESHQFTVDVNSTANTATFQTDTLDAGSYFLSDGDSNTNDITIEVRELSLTDGADGGTMFLQPSVETGETAQLQLDSNQGDFVAEISSEDFSQSQLDSMIAGASAPNHGGFVVVDNADTTVNVDFSQVDASAGEYNFTVAGAGTTAEVTTSIQLTEPGQKVVEFDDSVVEGVEGDRTWVTVNMQETDKAQLNLTWSPNDEPITVLSGNITADESQVKIPINTHELFKGDGSAIVDTDDVVNGSFTPTDAMDASTYDSSAEEIWGMTSTLNMVLYDENDNRMDRGTFRVTDRATDGMTTYTVSQSVVDNTDGSNINNVMENGAPTDGAIAEGDYLAVVVEGSGFFGYADSLDQLEDNGVYLNATHLNPPFGGNADSLSVDSFHTNEENGTMVAFYEVPQDYSGNQYEVSFDVYNKETASNDDTIANYNHYTEKTESFSSTITVELPSFSLDSDSFNLAPEKGQEITGTTNVAPGAEVDVVAQTPDASDAPFYESATAEVAADGTWTATVDLTGETQGTEFNIDAELLDYTANSESLTDSADGVIGKGTGAAGILSVSTDAPSEVTVGDDASLTVTLENTGKNAATGTVSITVDGEEVTSEEVELEAGGTQEFTADFDTSSAGDISYSVTTTGDDGEEDDSASGTLTVSEESSDGEDGTDGEDGEDGEDDDSSGSPGFGVAVALVALLSAAMLALRRQN